MIVAESDYRNILRTELERRCQKTAKYSLRAFARDLSLPPSRLSEILNGKQGLSIEGAGRISALLGHDSREREIFCDLVESQHARSKTSRELAAIRLQKHRLDSSYFTIEPDLFRFMADWYHVGILLLIDVKGFQSDPAWIAKALGISLAEARGAIDRLERFELIAIKDGKISALHGSVATKEGVPSEALRRCHRQILEKAMLALELQSSDQREFSANMMAIDPKILPEAKRWLKGFRRRFALKMARGKSRTELYCLSLQFFNLTPTKVSP